MFLSTLLDNACIFCDFHFSLQVSNQIIHLKIYIHFIRKSPIFLATQCNSLLLSCWKTSCIIQSLDQSFPIENHFFLLTNSIAKHLNLQSIRLQLSILIDRLSVVYRIDFISIWNLTQRQNNKQHNFLFFNIFLKIV